MKVGVEVGGATTKARKSQSWTHEGQGLIPGPFQLLDGIDCNAADSSL